MILTTLNLDKYIIQFGQMNFQIWTNTICILEKYILQKMIIENELGRPKSILTTLNLRRESWVGQQPALTLYCSIYSKLMQFCQSTVI